MSDSTEKKDSILPKIGGWFGIILAVLAGMFFIDQGEVFGETLPSGWTRLKQVLAHGGEKAKQAYWQSVIWLKSYLKLAGRITLIWWTVAGMLLVAGIVGKSRGQDETAMLALRLVGVYLFAAYWFVCAMLAKPLYYGMHALKKGAVVAANAVGESVHHWLGKLGLETPVPELTATAAEKIEAGAKEFQRFFYTVTSIVLLFGTFFAPSGEWATGVALLAVGLCLATLAAFSAKHGWKSELGWKLLAGAVLIAFVSLVLRLFFHIDVPAWLARRNTSELIVLVTFSLPCILFCVGAFSKEKKGGFNLLAKRVFWLSLPVLALLAFKGVLTTHELASTTDTTRDKMQKIEDTATDRVLDGAQKIVDKKVDMPAEHIVTGGFGTAPRYVAPPASPYGAHDGRSALLEPSHGSQAAGPTHARRKVAVPAAEKPKQYASPGQVLNDLDDTGY